VAAKAKRAEEQRPWAIMIIKAADHPQEEAEAAAAIIRPICLIEE